MLVALFTEVEVVTDGPAVTPVLLLDVLVSPESPLVRLFALILSPLSITCGLLINKSNTSM